MPVVINPLEKNRENTVQDDSEFSINFKMFYSKENSDHFFEAISQIRNEMEKKFGIYGRNDVLLNYTKNMLKNRKEPEREIVEPEKYVESDIVEEGTEYSGVAIDVKGPQIQL